VKAVIYIEGGSSGPNSKLGQQECQRGFRKLLEKCGFRDRMPRLFASGSRGEAFNDFKNAHNKKLYSGFVAMLIDSEDPVKNPEEPWLHLNNRTGDHWNQPSGTHDDQVLLMTTCQETWILADLLVKNGSQIPVDLENRHRDRVLADIQYATKGSYQKSHGRQFNFLGAVDPDRLSYLKSFARVRRILQEKLSA